MVSEYKGMEARLNVEGFTLTRIPINEAKDDYKKLQKHYQEAKRYRTKIVHFYDSLGIAYKNLPKEEKEMFSSTTYGIRQTELRDSVYWADRYK